MVGAASTVLVEQTLHLPLIEVARVSSARRLPRAERKVTEAACKPVGERHLKAKLPAHCNPRRKQVFYRFPQRVFTGAAVKLEIGRHCQRPIHEPVREE